MQECYTIWYDETCMWIASALEIKIGLLINMCYRRRNLLFTYLLLLTFDRNVLKIDMLNICIDNLIC